VLALLLFIAAAGAAHVWYSGNQPVSSPAPVVTQPDVSNQIKHIQPAANTPIGVSVQNLSSPVKAGAKADVAIRTLPQAKCTITVSYDKEKTPIKAAGLVPKTADDFGMASWQWTVDPTAPAGKWPVTVICKKTKRSAVVTADLTVKR
jgi:hypothetical protein